MKDRNSFRIYHCMLKFLPDLLRPPNDNTGNEDQLPNCPYVAKKLQCRWTFIGDNIKKKKSTLPVRSSASGRENPNPTQNSPSIAKHDPSSTALRQTGKRKDEAQTVRFQSNPEDQMDRLLAPGIFLLLCLWALMAETRSFRPTATKAAAPVTTRIRRSLLPLAIAQINRRKRRVRGGGGRRGGAGYRVRVWSRREIWLGSEVQRSEAISTVDLESTGWIYPPDLTRIERDKGTDAADKDVMVVAHADWSS